MTRGMNEDRVKKERNCARNANEIYEMTVFLRFADICLGNLGFILIGSSHLTGICPK